MPEQPPVPSSFVRRFNALVETVDALTLGRFDRVSNVPRLVGLVEQTLGPENSYARMLRASATELGYFPPVNVPQPQAK